MTMLTSKSQKGKGEDDDEVIKDSGNDFFLSFSPPFYLDSLSITTFISLLVLFSLIIIIKCLAFFQ